MPNVLDPAVLRDELEAGVVRSRTSTMRQMLSAPVATETTRPITVATSSRARGIQSDRDARRPPGRKISDGEQREVAPVEPAAIPDTTT